MSDYKIILYEPQSKNMRCGGAELLDEWAALPGSWIWLNVSGAPDDGEKKMLGERFGLPKLAIQDAQRARHSPKIEVFEATVFIILRDLVSAVDDDKQEVVSFSLLLGSNFLVSRHYHSVPALEGHLRCPQRVVG